MYKPQALNRYAYVLNNPYKYTDPDGHYYWLVEASSPAISSFFRGVFTWALENGLLVHTSAAADALPGVVVAGNTLATTGDSSRAVGELALFSGLPIFSSVFQSSYLRAPNSKTNSFIGIGKTAESTSKQAESSSINGRGMGGSSGAITDENAVTYWDKGTFKSPQDSLTVHVGYHGNGRDSARYTSDLVGYQSRYYSGDPSLKVTPSILKDGSGTAIKVTDKGTGGFCIWNPKTMISKQSGGLVTGK